MMPVRLPFRRVQLAPGMILYDYWGPLGYCRPHVDVYAAGPAGDVVRVKALIDTGSDHVLLAHRVARKLQLNPPFHRLIHERNEFFRAGRPPP